MSIGARIILAIVALVARCGQEVIDVGMRFDFGVGLVVNNIVVGNRKRFVFILETFPGPDHISVIVFISLIKIETIVNLKVPSITTLVFKIEMML